MKKNFIGIFFKYKKFALNAKKAKEKLFKPNKYIVMKCKNGWILINIKHLGKGDL